jgi:hypothetical protein
MEGNLMAIPYCVKYKAQFDELSKYDRAIFTDYLDTGMSIKELAEDYEVPAITMRAFLIYHDRIKHYDRVRSVEDVCKN